MKYAVYCETDQCDMSCYEDDASRTHTHPIIKDAQGSDHYVGEEEIVFFPMLTDAREYVTKLIKIANDEAVDNEGKLPSWIYTVSLLEVQATVISSMDGLILSSPVSSATEILIVQSDNWK